MDYYQAMIDVPEEHINSMPIHIVPIDEHREDLESSITENDIRLNDFITCSSLEDDLTALRHDVDCMMVEIHEIKQTLNSIKRPARCIIS